MSDVIIFLACLLIVSIVYVALKGDSSWNIVCGLFFGIVFAIAVFWTEYIFSKQHNDLWIIIVIAILLWGIAIAGLCDSTIYYMRSKNKVRTTTENRELAFLEIKQGGFKPTVKHRYGKNLIKIDENSGQWFVMHDDWPILYELHPLSSIESVKKIQRSARSGGGVSVRVMKGVSVGSYQSSPYYTECGVQITLNDIKTPSVYIDCLDAPHFAEDIVSLFRAMKKMKTAQPHKPQESLDEDTEIPYDFGDGVNYKEELTIQMIKKGYRPGKFNLSFSHGNIPDELMPKYEKAVGLAYEYGAITPKLIHDKLGTNSQETYALIDLLIENNTIEPFESIEIPQKIIVPPVDENVKTPAEAGAPD